MDLFEAQDFFKQMFPDKLVIFDFDDRCLNQVEIVFTEGLPHLLNHLEYRRVKVSVEGMDPQYVSIKPHRMNISFDDLKNLLNSKEEVYSPSSNP